MAHMLNAQCINIGYRTPFKSESILLGPGTVAKNDYDVVIGAPTSEGDIFLRDIDIRKLSDRVRHLEELVEKQHEIIETLWYHPGGPGYEEAKEQWNADI